MESADMAKLTVLIKEKNLSSSLFTFGKNHLKQKKTLILGFEDWNDFVLLEMLEIFRNIKQTVEAAILFLFCCTEKTWKSLLCFLLF